MSIRPRQAVHSAWLRALLALAVILAVVAGLGSPAPAAEPDKAEVSAQEVDRLVKTLEDPKAREKLVLQLRALKAAQKKQEDEEVGPASALLEALSARVEAFGSDLLETTSALSDVPRLTNWLEAQMRSESARARWLEIITKLLIVLVAGFAAEKLATLLLRRPHAAIDARAPATRIERVPLVVARAVLDALPIAAFGLAANAAIPLLTMAPDPREAAGLLTMAYLVARLSMVAAHTTFMPRHPMLRLLPVGDETAHYLYIWARRLIGVTVYGAVISGSARLLGLPAAGHSVLLKVLGLIVATMAVVLILQNRAAVAAWIRSRGTERMDHRLVILRNRLADVWHVFACAYLVMIYGIWALRIAGGFEFMLRASLLTAAILVGARVAGAVVRRAIDRGFAVSQDLRTQFPQLELRANRYLPVLHGVLRGLIGLVTVMALLQTWGIAAFAWLDTDFGRRFVSAAVTITIVLVLALAAWEVISGGIERYLTQAGPDGKPIERSARARTLLPLLRNAILVLLVIVVGLTVLSEVGVNIAPLLAGAGVVGLAVGFGSQKLVQDLITGAFILFENTISVGDVVKLGEHSGSVEAISIRTIRLRDGAGAVHTIPFSAVSTIVNMTKDFSYAVFDVGVSYHEDTDAVAGALRAIGAEMQADPDFSKLIAEPLEVLGVDRFGPSEVVIKARIKTLPVKQWAVAREFNRRMKRRFDELGIEIPYPHQTVYFGQDKPDEGKAALAGGGREALKAKPAKRSRMARGGEDREREEELVADR